MFASALCLMALSEPCGHSLTINRGLSTISSELSISGGVSVKESQDPVAELVELIRQISFRIALSEDAASAGAISQDDAVKVYNNYTEIAHEARQKLISLNRYDVFVPLLRDENPLTRLWAAQVLEKSAPDLARITYLQLADIGRRDFGDDKDGAARIDFHYFSIGTQAEEGLWRLMHGTMEGFYGAPERFWEQQ